MKNLEEFIHANRNAFDDQEPSDKIWAQISNSLFGKSGSSNTLIFWRAAAILFMGLSVFLLLSRVTTSQDDTLVLNEFKDVESYYIAEIAHRVNMIETIKGDESGLNGFTNDFNQLEAMYEVLKDEMKSNPSLKVKEALVLNLLVRIDLLNKQLEKLDEEESGDSDDAREVSI